MHGKHIGSVVHSGAVVVGVAVALALAGGCSASKKTTTSATTGAAAQATQSVTAATTATTATTAANAPSGNVGAEYLAAIGPVDKLRDEYEASKGTPARATIAPLFAASLRSFDAVAAKLPTSGRTETDMQTMISDDQLVASEVSAGDLTLANVDRDNAAHAVVRADLGLPPA